MNNTERAIRQIINRNAVCWEDLLQFSPENNVRIRIIDAIALDTDRTNDDILASLKSGDVFCLNEHSSAKKFLRQLIIICNINQDIRAAVASFARSTSPFQKIERAIIQLHENLASFATSRNVTFEDLFQISSMVRPRLSAEDINQTLSGTLDIKVNLGDPTCINNAGSPYLKCAVAPNNDCANCPHYEQN